MVRVMVPVDRFQRFHGHAQIARRFEFIGTPLHEPHSRRVAEGVAHDLIAGVWENGPHEPRKSFLRVGRAPVVLARFQAKPKNREGTS
jgi:hypothetical protein